MSFAHVLAATCINAGRKIIKITINKILKIPFFEKFARSEDGIAY